jgi:uncharacterized Zn finger protein (UPF0148 family)
MYTPAASGFSMTASAFPVASEMPAGDAMESKVCEWGCGRSFMRPVPAMAKDGMKVCPQCRERRSIEQRERLYVGAQAREAKARRGLM